MPGNPWDAADMAIVALRLTQRLSGLMVEKGLLSHDDLQSTYDTVAASLEADPSAANALAYFRAVTPPVLRRG